MEVYLLCFRVLLSESHSITASLSLSLSLILTFSPPATDVSLMDWLTIQTRRIPNMFAFAILTQTISIPGKSTSCVFA